MVIGSMMPGNSTVLRTGTMISASAGNGGKRAAVARARLGYAQATWSQPRKLSDFCNVISRQPSAAERRTAL